MHKLSFCHFKLLEKNKIKDLLKQKKHVGYFNINIVNSVSIPQHMRFDRFLRV